MSRGVASDLDGDQRRGDRVPPEGGASRPERIATTRNAAPIATKAPARIHCVPSALAAPASRNPAAAM